MSDFKISQKTRISTLSWRIVPKLRAGVRSSLPRVFSISCCSILTSNHFSMSLCTCKSLIGLLSGQKASDLKLRQALKTMQTHIRVLPVVILLIFAVEVPKAKFWEFCFFDEVLGWADCNQHPSKSSWWFEILAKSLWRLKN